jgi:galactosamine-6-phosphate isomerase
MLKIHAANSYAQLSRRAARIILSELRRRPQLLLCASAGGTPAGTYEMLAKHYANEPVLFRKLRVLQIDEWSGLPADSPASCKADLEAKLLRPLGIGSDRYFGFRTDSQDPEREWRLMAQWLAKHGPIDVCVLGLGVNGHIAMNEPASEFVPHPHVARLTKSSQKHPLLRGLAKKPEFGLTLGLGDILCSRKILLLVSGQHKRAALRRTLKPCISPRFPASFLWLHPDSTVICDRAAFAA